MLNEDIWDGVVNITIARGDFAAALALSNTNRHLRYSVVRRSLYDKVVIHTLAMLRHFRMLVEHYPEIGPCVNIFALDFVRKKWPAWRTIVVDVEEEEEEEERELDEVCHDLNFLSDVILAGGRGLQLFSLNLDFQELTLFHQIVCEDAFLFCLKEFVENTSTLRLRWTLPYLLGWVKRILGYSSQNVEEMILLNTYSGEEGLDLQLRLPQTLHSFTCTFPVKLAFPPPLALGPVR